VGLLEIPLGFFAGLVGQVSLSSRSTAFWCNLGRPDIGIRDWLVGMFQSMHHKFQVGFAEISKRVKIAVHCVTAVK
jgi:hypothetical protein